MERELENKIFMLNEFINKDDMEENIKKYIDILKKNNNKDLARLSFAAKFTSNEEAFEIIYRKYEGLIYYIALSITKNKDDAEEVVQDTFLNMFNSIDTYEEKNKFKQWLMQIARNLSYNKVTRNKEKDTIKDEEYINKTASNDDSIDYILTIKNTLDEISSHIIISKIVYNFSFKEIAKDLNMSVGQVQGIYYQSLKKLKKVF